MELRAFARRIVETPDLDLKLARSDEALTDEEPGEPLRLTSPGRADTLRIVPAREAPVPGLDGMSDPAQRPRLIHAFANHELQAVELFAWALLAFPDAPADFRSGLLRILHDEQRHTRMYVSRLREFGVSFGDFPVSGYFWNKVDDIRTPAHFVCAMALTFENANLDHTTDSAEAARRAGDDKTAAVIDRVHEDEITHVAFGWRWLRYFKEPDQSMWEAYSANVTWPLRAAKAKGARFHPEGRVAAGLDEAFIARLEAAERDTVPDGKP